MLINLNPRCEFEFDEILDVNLLMKEIERLEKKVGKEKDGYLEFRFDDLADFSDSSL